MKASGEAVRLSNNDFQIEVLETVRRVEVRTNRLVTETFAGQYHSVFKGRGMDFEEVREYVPGDEVRSIDWNVTARAGKPYVKKHTEERELTILLVVDVSASGNFGSGTRSKREVAAELASALAFSASHPPAPLPVVSLSSAAVRVPRLLVTGVPVADTR